MSNLGIEIVKAAATIGGSYGARVVIKGACAVALANEDLTPAKDICVRIGTIALAGVVGKVAGDYIEDQLNSVEEAVEKIKHIFNDKEEQKDDEAEVTETEVVEPEVVDPESRN